MRIPTEHTAREAFYLDIIEKCEVSKAERKADYSSLRAWYLFGAGPEESPAIYNKIYPHMDQLTSFLYSAETTRFSINIGASVPNQEHKKIPTLTQALNDEWLNSNADQVFSSALTWALTYCSTFIKLIYNNGIHPYMVEPASIGVLREDTPYLDRQEALTQTYYVTKSELMARLYSHPKRTQILDRITASYNPLPTEVPEGVDRIVMSQTNPTIYGTVNLDLYGYNRYKARVAEDTVEMRELWLWNDETMDYQVVTMATPDVIIYDRAGESVFLKGELPFVQIAPNPQYDYFWGQSECQRLIYLQQMRNRRMTEILDLLSKQVAPPTALMGFSGILDEKNFALNRAGGLLSTDMPNAKVEKLAPNIPQDLYGSIREIDQMFEEASGIVSVLQGRGESGVRSAGHASQLARLGSSRAKKRALVVEDSLEKVATLYLKLMQTYDNTHYTTEEGTKFIAEQFTKDFVVKVDAHSNSPIFTEDLRQLAFNLFKAQAIDKESLLDLLEPPMKQELKDRLKRMEAKQAQQAQQQPQQKSGGKPDLKAVGGE
ncbi:UNVERIFIED_CONTAM: portal protein [Bacteriophage sp.]